MKLVRNVALGLGLALAVAVGCHCGGDDGDDDSSAGTLTAPTNLKISTVEGKPHLTWTDGDNETHYMIERMDHSASGSEWAPVEDAEELVPNSTQFHDASTQAGKTYMYRVVAMQGNERTASNEVTWP